MRLNWNWNWSLAFQDKEGEINCFHYKRLFLLLAWTCFLQLFQLNFPQYHKNEAQIISYTEVTYNVTFVWKIRTSNGDLSIFSDHRKLFVGSPKSFCKRRELFLLPPPLLSNVLHCAQPMCFMWQPRWFFLHSHNPNICLLYRYFQRYLHNLHKLNLSFKTLDEFFGGIKKIEKIVH